MPPHLRDASTVRVSHLVNTQRVSRLISQSVDKGTSGKFRVALDGKSRAWAIKCFRTQALPEKTGTDAQGCLSRSNWPRRRILHEIDMMRQASADIKVKEVIEAHHKIYVVHTLGDSSIGGLFHKVPQNLRVDAVHFVMWRMAQKLQDMHLRGYLHGDVKVHNALVRAGSVMLCDFGATQPMETDGLVQPVLCSTFPPPEQALGQRFGPPADVWGLGATLMDMFCLHPHNALLHAHTFNDTAENLRDFAVWRHGLLDIYGWFHPERLLRDTSKWGAFFAPAYDIDPCGVTYVIVKMLDPDPRQRARLPQVIAHFSPHSAQDHVDYNTVTALFDSLAQKGKVQRTVKQLQQVLQYNIGPKRPVPGPAPARVAP